MNLDFAPIERALGMQWCIYSDTFGFSIVFVAPFIFPAKILLKRALQEEA